MEIHVQPRIEAELQRVARERGRDIQAIIAEAFDQYLTASSITDVTSKQIGQAQDALVSELPSHDDWQGEGRADEAR